MSYLYKVAIATDQWINVVIFDGQPDETMSSAAYRMEQQDMFWGFLRPVIDWIFSRIEDEHCKQSYYSELSRKHLPKELQSID